MRFGKSVHFTDQTNVPVKTTLKQDTPVENGNTTSQDRLPMSVVGVRFHGLKTPNSTVLSHRHLAETVVDIGCGNGRHMIFGHNVGIDLDLKALKKAKRKGEVILADAQYLPIRNKAFDMALLINVLNFVDNPFLALREAVRVSSLSPLVKVYPCKRAKHQLLK